MTDVTLDADATAALAQFRGSPEQATLALAEKSAAFQKANTPTPSTDSGAARAQLESLSATASWRDKFFSGDQATRAQFAELTAKIATGNATADVIAGPVPSQMFETTTNGELNTRNRADAVAGLQEIGLDAASVLQAIEGAEVGPHEIAMAKQAKAVCLGDEGWVSRYMKGGFAERRTLTLINTILAGAAA
jgi:hypothetical protein